MQIKLRVNRNHIRKGKPSTEDRCPIALSLRAAGFECPEVNDDEIAFQSTNGTQFTIPTSVRAQRFIKAFDSKRPVKPINLRLTV